MFASIVSEENFLLAYKNTQRGALKYNPNAIDFYLNEAVNLWQLRNSVADGSYRHGPYHYRKISEGKERELYIPQYRDKIVHHAINNQLAEYYRVRFIEDSFANIKGRGNRAAVLRLKQQAHDAYRQWGDQTYILKIDIQKFFQSINPYLLKSILRRTIDCKYTTTLLSHIVDTCPKGEGLPLGNLTSQLFANVYLNEFDQYCYIELELPYYLRYADDIFIMLPNKSEARELKGGLVFVLDQQLSLTAHKNKTQYMPLKGGIRALGYRVTPKGILMTGEQRRKLESFIRDMPSDFTVEEYYKQQNYLDNWVGRAKIANNFRYLNSIVATTPWLEWDSKRDLVGIVVEPTYKPWDLVGEPSGYRLVT